MRIQMELRTAFPACAASGKSAVASIVVACESSVSFRAGISSHRRRLCDIVALAKAGRSPDRQGPFFGILAAISLFTP